jgi:sugar fermentation stimulation protein A
MHLARGRRLTIGALGEKEFAPGYYVYVGSAMQGLSARLARHGRRRKRLHWHIDYLRQHASKFVALPIRSAVRQECDIARAMADRFPAGPVGFGCSDCACPTHLFSPRGDPLRDPAFHHLLQHFRMTPPVGL